MANQPSARADSATSGAPLLSARAGSATSGAPSPPADGSGAAVSSTKDFRSRRRSTKDTGPGPPSTKDIGRSVRDRPDGAGQVLPLPDHPVEARSQRDRAVLLVAEASVHLDLQEHRGQV